jgi:D-alanyl-D-alanine carboxypeptidase (penicillin-binding protein 5/6)
MLRSKRISRLIAPLALCIGLLVLSGTAKAQTLETIAQQAIILDFDTGAVLLDKNADEPMHPSSMSKLMTIEALFKAIKEGHVKLTDKFIVSEHAWKTGGAGTDGSTMFAPLNSSVPVEDLIRGITVQSGNDACIVIAEGLAGTETEFANNLNERAKELGMTHSHFMNATGLPDPDHLMTARDLATLARHIIKSYPEFYHYFSEREFTWNKITQQNRNPLLYLDIGADGLKTGHTEQAGYGLVASAIRDGHRLILVVNGLPTQKDRAEESRRLMEIGFRDFRLYKLLDANATVDEAAVWNGEMSKVPLVVKDPVQVMMRRAARGGLKVVVRYKGPVVAPIAKGQEVGTLNVTAPGAVPVTVPVYAGAAVDRVGPLGQIGNAVYYLLQGHATAPENVAPPAVPPAATAPASGS